MLIKGRGKKLNLSVIVSICNTAVSQFIDSRGQYFSYSGQFHFKSSKNRKLSTGRGHIDLKQEPKYWAPVSSECVCGD